jgi:hypothetical protein
MARCGRRTVLKTLRRGVGINAPGQIRADQGVARLVCGRDAPGTGPCFRLGICRSKTEIGRRTLPSARAVESERDEPGPADYTIKTRHHRPAAIAHTTAFDHSGFASFDAGASSFPGYRAGFHDCLGNWECDHLTRLETLSNGLVTWRPGAAGCVLAIRQDGLC